MATYLPQYVYSADIGSMKAPAGNSFGWAGRSTDPNVQQHSWQQGTHPPKLVDAVANELTKGTKVALGFECPLWVPVRTTPSELTSGRIGDGQRPWSAQAGPQALAIGLVQVPWILREIRNKTPNAEAFMDWDLYQESEGGLFIWEAFVSGQAKSGVADPNPHIRDAKVGVEAFIDALPSLKTSVTKPLKSRTRSLIGAALLWSGWSTDLSLLDQTCRVIKP